MEYKMSKAFDEADAPELTDAQREQLRADARVWREILGRNSRNVVLTEDRVVALMRLVSLAEAV